jgi:hypothetical protein
MADGTLKLIVNPNYSGMSLDISMLLTQGNRLFVIGFDGSLLVKQEVNSENEFKTDFIPLFRISMFDEQSYFKAFLDYASGKGIKTVDENLLEGKMEAMKDHLADSKSTLEKVLSMLDKSIK